MRRSVLAGRPKDIESLAAFTTVHATDAKEAVSQRYLAEVAQRNLPDSESKPDRS